MSVITNIITERITLHIFLTKMFAKSIFYRIQLWKEFAVTPNIQYIKNPALNPDDDSLWVFGLRARLAF